MDCLKVVHKSWRVMLCIVVTKQWHSTDSSLPLSMEHSTRMEFASQAPQKWMSKYHIAMHTIGGIKTMADNIVLAFRSFNSPVQLTIHCGNTPPQIMFATDMRSRTSRTFLKGPLWHLNSECNHTITYENNTLKNEDLLELVPIAAWPKLISVNSVETLPNGIL